MHKSETIILNYNKDELLVVGFIKEIEKMYKIQVPNVVKDIIYKYQRLIYDKWNKKYSYQSIEIDATESMITFTEYACAHGTAYGSEVIDDGIFEWKIKIMSMSQFAAYSWFAIGIIEDNEDVMEKHKEDLDWDESENGYQLLLDGIRGFLYTMNISAKQTPNYQCKWLKENDILEMTLNWNRKTLSFKLNGKDHGIAFRNISQIKYRFVLSVVDLMRAQFALVK
eukprot:420637_1